MLKGEIDVNRRIREERGSVTIEATISLSAFMFAIVTILTIVNICIVQAKMSYAINATAKEISQYSYLYSLTGLNDSQKNLYEKGKLQTEDAENVLKNVNTAYNEMQKLGNKDYQGVDDIQGIMDAWDDTKGSVDTIADSGSAIMSSLEDIAKDPKKLMFGIAKIGASDTYDLAKSKLIAAPLSKVMCRKHLVDEKDGDVEAYLRKLGVVPGANGKYIDGLDFGKSLLFPYGTSEIRVSVSYDVKVIPLLPINSKFHFTQSAITHGWFAGDMEFKTKDKDKYEQNKSIWVESTVNERASFIRHMAIKDLEDDGYVQTKGLTDVQMFNKEKNEFVMISSMNPLWSAEGEPPKTLDDLDDDAIRESLERLCGKMASTTDGLNKVKTKVNKSDGTTETKEENCTNAKNTIYLVIPTDEGLEDRIRSIMDSADTRGVNIELIPSYGNGARATKVPSDKEKDGDENTESGGTGQ